MRAGVTAPRAPKEGSSGWCELPSFGTLKAATCNPSVWGGDGLTAESAEEKHGCLRWAKRTSPQEVRRLGRPLVFSYRQLPAPRPLALCGSILSRPQVRDYNFSQIFVDKPAGRVRKYAKDAKCVNLAALYKSCIHPKTGGLADRPWNARKFLPQATLRKFPGPPATGPRRP